MASDMQTEIIIPVGVAVDLYQHPSGWGEQYQSIKFNGAPASVEVGPKGLVIRINPKGDLTITNLGGVYQTLAPQNLWLENSRPWNK